MVVQLDAFRAAITGLTYSVEATDALENDCRDIVSNHMASFAGEIPQLLPLLKPILDAILFKPTRSVPFRILTTVLLELKEWTTADEIIKDATASLDSLLTLLDSKSNHRPSTCSSSIFPALQVCVLLLGDKIQQMSFAERIISYSFTALNLQDWQHRAGGLETLTALLQAVGTAHPNPPLPRSTQLLSNFLELAVVISQRIMRYDPSQEVRYAAGKLLVAIQKPTQPLPAVAGPHPALSEAIQQQTAESSYAETEVIEVGANLNENFAGSGTKSSQTDSSALMALALEPLPQFRTAPSTTPSSKLEGNVGSHFSAASNKVLSHDTFSPLQSEFDSLNSALEVEVEKFLRGSILPGGLEMLKYAEEPATAAAMGAKALRFQHDSFESKLGCHAELLRRALEEQIGSNPLGTKQGDDELLHFSVEEIEAILRRCLDLHSEQAYDFHTQRAETALVHASLEMRDGWKDADAELQRCARALEGDVHRAVADEQTEFMETAMPLLADLLADPPVLEQWLMSDSC